MLIQSTPRASLLSSFKVRDASYMFALLGALVLLGAARAWWNIGRQPEAQLAAGRLEQNSRTANSAAIAIFMAFGLSVVAAILAIGGWLF